jgi:hypothetical protein
LTTASPVGERAGHVGWRVKCVCVLIPLLCVICPSIRGNIYRTLNEKRCREELIKSIVNKFRFFNPDITPYDESLIVWCIYVYSFVYFNLQKKYFWNWTKRSHFLTPFYSLQQPIDLKKRNNKYLRAYNQMRDFLKYTMHNSI